LKARAQVAASAALIGLIFLGVAWELFLAPLKPGGSWLVLKVLPLMAALFGVLHGKRYTYQWASMLVWLYIGEGATRAFTDGGMAARLAWLEIVLGAAFFVAAVLSLRGARAP
jgi:uncharacterized membrane protein